MLVRFLRAFCFQTPVAFVLFSSGCAVVNHKIDQTPLEGPPIKSIVTPYDKALMCLNGAVERQFTFAVGAILDRTGREQFTEGGQGKYVIQGAGDVVQSALFKSGVTLLNRLDPRVLETDFKWGLRKPGSVVAVDFFVTGAVNSLDFLPGGGIDLSFDGVGTSFSSHRILVGLDLALTQAKTGRIVAAVSLQKQIATKELNFGAGRFFGGNLVSMSSGIARREALQFVQRQMLNLATFELLAQLLSPEKYDPCANEIAKAHDLDRNLDSVRKLLAWRDALTTNPTSTTAKAKNSTVSNSDTSLAEPFDVPVDTWSASKPEQTATTQSDRAVDVLPISESALDDPGLSDAVDKQEHKNKLIRF